VPFNAVSAFLLETPDFGSWFPGFEGGGKMIIFRGFSQPGERVEEIFHYVCGRIE
jgi:hypothetical protein